MLTIRTTQQHVLHCDYVKVKLSSIWTFWTVQSDLEIWSEIEADLEPSY